MGKAIGAACVLCSAVVFSYYLLSDHPITINIIMFAGAAALFLTGISYWRWKPK